MVLLLVVLVVVRRRRPAVSRSAPAQPRPQRAPKPERVDRIDPGPRKRKAPQAPTGRESVPPAELGVEQTVLLTRSEGDPSLHDTLLALGPDLVALRSLRQASLEAMDPLSWAGMVKDRRAGRLARLALAWSRQVALQRVEAWLRAHPLVKGGNLEVQVPGSLEPADLASLALTQPDGLGVTLDGEQTAVLDHARSALSRAFADQPFALLAASSDLGALLPEELQAELEQGHPRHALPLLCGGISALDWAAKAGLGRPGIGAEFREALREHAKLVGTPVPSEGPVAHALEVVGGGRMEGIGLLLAATAGAAFSSSTVILRISKRIGEIKANPLLSTFARLGSLACAALDDESSPDRALLLENVRFLLGEPLLDRASKRAAALAREAERLAAKEPLWKGGAAEECKSPELALFSLHELQVKLALERAKQASERLLELIDRLAHPGGSGEEQIIGHRRLGYVIAGLGAPLLRKTSTELLSAGREAMAMTAALAAVPAPPARPARPA